MFWDTGSRETFTYNDQSHPLRYENDKLTVSHDLLNKRAWAPCFSIEGVHLPTGYYFGMSATTGDLSDNHDLISVKTYELDTAPGVSKDERPGILPEVITHILAVSWPVPYLLYPLLYCYVIHYERLDLIQYL